MYKRQRIYSSGLESSAHLCAAFPLFSPLLLSAARTLYTVHVYTRIHHPVDSVPNGRFSPGRVPYASIRLLPGLAAKFFSSNLVFLAHRARCVQRERAHECTRFTVPGASDAKHIPFSPSSRRAKIGWRSISTRDLGEARTRFFSVPNHRSFLMLIDVSSAGRGREVVPRFATKGPDKWQEGRRCPGSIERGLLRANKKPLRLPFGVYAT